MGTTSTAEGSRTADLHELVSRARAMASLDLDTLADSELLGSLVGLCEAASAVQAALARTIEHADRNETTVADCGLRSAGWMARHVVRPAGPCRRQVRCARTAVQHFGDFVGAAAEGTVGWEHVELLVAVSNPRNRPGLASVQSELLDAACRLPWGQWEALVRRVAAEADEDGGHDPDEDTHANRLRLSSLPDGALDVSGRLVGEWGFVVDSTVDAIADELFHTYTRDQQLDPDLVIPDRVTLRALALAEACRRARAVDLARTAPPRPEAVVVIEHDATHDTTTFTDSYGRAVPATAIELMLADADYRALTLDTAGNPLALGRRRRLISREQRTALTVRDGGCVFPGCDTPAAWCDGHHVVSWRDGGATDIENLALLCRHHHGITHRRGWAMQRTGSGTDRADGHCSHPAGGLFSWRTPSGRLLHSEHRSGAPPG